MAFLLPWQYHTRTPKWLSTRNIPKMQSKCLIINTFAAGLFPLLLCSSATASTDKSAITPPPTATSTITATRNDNSPTTANQPQTAEPTETVENRFRELETNEIRFQTWLSLVAVCLGAIAIVLAIFSIAGVFFIRWIIEKEVEKKTNLAHHELSARIAGAEGLLFGRLSRTEDETITRPDLLDLAISFTQDAFSELADDPKSAYYWRTVNNLVYYYSLRQHPDDRAEAMALADKLVENAPVSRRLAARLTYAYSLFRYCPNDAEKLGQSRDIFQRVIANPDATNEMVGDAKRSLAQVEHLLAELSGANVQ